MDGRLKNHISSMLGSKCIRLWGFDNCRRSTFLGMLGTFGIFTNNPVPDCNLGGHFTLFMHILSPGEFHSSLLAETNNENSGVFKSYVSPLRYSVKHSISTSYESFSLIFENP